MQLYNHKSHRVANIFTTREYILVTIIMEKELESVTTIHEISLNPSNQVQRNENPLLHCVNLSASKP